MSSIKSSKIRLSDLILKILINIAAAFSVVLLIGILAYVFLKGIGSVNLTFLTTVTSTLKGTVGIAGNIVNTLYIIVITLLIATPLGVGSAIYLNEYAKPGKLVRAIEFTTETLSGIPSIIFGLFGMMFFGTGLGLGYSILTGALTLTLMVLPLIMRTTEEALMSVPDSFREGSFGLGAGRLRTVFKIIVPSAMPGILSGVILAIGRIVGETAALMYTAGTATSVCASPMGTCRTLAVHMYQLLCEGREMNAAYATAVVLLVMVILINLLSSAIAKKLTKK